MPRARPHHDVKVAITVNITERHCLGRHATVGPVPVSLLHKKTFAGVSFTLWMMQKYSIHDRCITYVRPTEIEKGNDRDSGCFVCVCSLMVQYDEHTVKILFPFPVLLSHHPVDIAGAFASNANGEKSHTLHKGRTQNRTVIFVRRRAFRPSLGPLHVQRPGGELPVPEVLAVPVKAGDVGLEVDRAEVQPAVLVHVGHRDLALDLRHELREPPPQLPRVAEDVDGPGPPSATPQTSLGGGVSC